MIPKIIHYCWFGRNNKPELAIKCINSWKRKCPDYDIIEWNEDNFDISTCPLYVRQAYDVKKWAFVTDYVRLKVVFDYGGIYLDTDVEVIKSFEHLLDEQAFFGFEYGQYIATGLGFGAEKNHPALAEMLMDYNNIPFVKEDGTYDELPCPIRNSRIFINSGLKQNDSFQHICGSVILPSEYLCPYDGRTGILCKTKNTISIHWYGMSWVEEEQKQRRILYIQNLKIQKRKDVVHNIVHIPNRILRMFLGNNKYNELKIIIKKRQSD